MEKKGNVVLERVTNELETVKQLVRIRESLFTTLNLTNRAFSYSFAVQSFYSSAPGDSQQVAGSNGKRSLSMYLE